MADDLRFKLRMLMEQIPHSKLNGGQVTAVILGGGFLFGLLVGACLLLGQPGVTSNPEPVVNAASPPSTTSPSPADADDRDDELAAERDRLRRELEAEQLRREVALLRDQLESLKTSPVSTEQERSPVRSRPTLPSPSAPSERGPSPGEATLDYWNRMNAIILQEASMRSAPAGGITAGNATGFLESRIQAADFAVTSIDSLDTTGVDQQVVELGRKLVNWYAEGRQVAETGRHLMTRASIQERQGSAGKMYQAAEHSHSKNVDAVNAAGEQVRQAMIRKYGINFPPLN